MVASCIRTRVQTAFDPARSLHPLWSPGTERGRTDMAQGGSRVLRSMTCLAIGLVGIVGGKLGAAEPAEEFLRALRDNQYFDVAVIYLDRLQDNPRVPADFRTELDYQRGWTLVEAAVVERDRAARERLLQEAKSSLERFLQEQPEHSKRAPARRQYAFLLREWGRMKLEQARPSNDEALLREAAGLFDRSQELFSEAVAELRDTLANLPSQSDSAAEADAPPDREYLRIEFLDSLLRAAEVFEDKAETVAADSPLRQTLLTEAAKQYGEMFAKYPTRLAGVQARLNQARVTKKLGDCDQALVYLTEDILNQEDDSPPVRRLKTRALLLAMECWLDDSRREYRQAIDRAEPWAGQIRPAEESDPDWTLLRLQLAKAHRAQADVVRERDAKDPMIKSSRDAARAWAQAVSRVPGE
jgi:hypothetical protein